MLFGKNKLESELPHRALAGIIRDSFSHKELTRLMASLGAVFPGVRIESLSHDELAGHFAEDALRDPALMELLFKALDKVHRTELEEICLLSPGEVKEMTSLVGEICREDKIGKIVWVLFRDEREEVRGLIPSFLRSVGEHLGREHEKVEEVLDLRKRFEKGNLTKKEVKAPKQSLLALSSELDEVKKLSGEREKKIDSLTGERDQLKEELKAKRREEDALRFETGKLKKEIAEREERARSLQASLEKGSEEEVNQLRRNLHSLGRENRKLAHQAEELREQILRLGRETEFKDTRSFQLIKDLEAAAEEKLALKHQTDLLKKETEALRHSMSFPRVEPPAPPRAKGKRLGIFVDMQNIWIAAKRFQRKIDFQKLLDLLILNRRLVKAIAYVVAVPELDQEPFFSMLKRKGFEVRARTLIRRADGSAKGNWDTGIVTDAIGLVDQKDLDIVLVVSGDGDFIDLFKFLKAKGVQVEAAGFPFSTAQDLPKSVDQFFPLNESILKEEGISAVVR